MKSIGATPAQLVFGDRPNLNRNFVFTTEPHKDVSKTIREWTTDRQKYQEQAIIIAQDITRRHQEEVEVYNKNNKTPRTVYAVGTRVLLMNPPSSGGRKRKRKLDTISTGPYEVMENDGSQYLIRNLITNVPQHVGVWRLRHYEEDSRVSPKSVALHDYKEEFEVEKVLSHTGTFKRKQNVTFRIRWGGKWNKPEHDTTKPWSGMKDNEVVHKYLRTIGEERHIPTMTQKEKAKETMSDMQKKKKAKKS